MSPRTRTSIKRSREAAGLTTTAADADEPSAKVQKVSAEPELKGVDVTASPRSVKDKIKLKLRTRYTPAYNLRRRRRLASVVRLDWNGMPASAQQGMRNLTGVLCYRSALLQSLLHQPQFCLWLTSYHEPQHCIWAEETPCVACVLRNLAKAYWSGESVDAAYVAVDKAFKANNWQNGMGGQQDPEEQLGWLVQKFSEQLPVAHFAVFESLTHFVLDSSTKCIACGHISSKPGDIEGSLAIDLLPRIKGGDLAAYVQQYLSYNVTDYKCDFCGDKATDKKRSRKIAHSPDFFAVQLKRFDWQGKKDSYPIPFNRRLDLESVRAPNNETKSKYDLSAVVLHSGTAKGGHYISMSRGPDGQWWKFDDRSKLPLTEAAVLASANKKSGGFTPYLLFYQRVR
ncbi:cysteine proteinase [Mollisia scopiformis]|uniref:Cysteine proteinase n=1 Tax=Mollisia scopiformis TaxID=149040 RepID=A0A132B875_MOLSC|nr:cysteine proteinase [Mollisia scopiformis]KUJ08453.1 cysteine proteinase [Mollisia scopiformis]